MINIYDAIHSRPQYFRQYKINHFDLSGLRQVYYYIMNKKPEPLPFHTPAF